MKPDLGVYIHWPYCARICPYCDFNVYRDRGKGDEQSRLVRAILEDLSAQAALIGDRRLVSIFFGGGTPSLMRPDAVAEIITRCRTLWTATGEIEITLEANPTDAEADRFEALAQAGIGRLSLGLQSLNDADLKALGRNHGADEGHRAARLAARHFARLSVDLIYARPGQTLTDWRAELTEVIRLGPEHISPYQLTIEPGTAFDRAVARGQMLLPDEDLAADFYDLTQEVLTEAGFDAYEVSNHARGPAARARHNLVYWQGQDYVGAGPGAHGRLTLAGQRVATQGYLRPADYINAVDQTGLGFRSRETLSPGQAAEERLLAGLRLSDGVAFADLEALALRPDRVASFVRDGLIVEDPVYLRATARGRLVLNHLTARLAMTGDAEAASRLGSAS